MPIIRGSVTCRPQVHNLTDATMIRLANNAEAKAKYENLVSKLKWYFKHHSSVWEVVETRNLDEAIFGMIRFAQEERKAKRMAKRERLELINNE